MAEWLYEDGVGERRAVLVEGARIVAARIERDSDGAQPGAILPAVLLPATGRGPRLVRLAGGEEALCVPPRGLSDGAALTVEIMRSAIPEDRLVKRAKARPTEAPPSPAPTLRQRIAADTLPVRDLHPVGADELESAGWGELLDMAENGLCPFPGGIARLALTPAMTVIDIDGDLPPFALAEAGARAAARMIRALDIGGSVAIDLPTLANKAERVAVAQAFDAALAPAPFERTAINGFGLLHVILPRTRPSLPEYLRFAPVESAALTLLRRAQRAGGAGSIMLLAHPRVTGWLEDRGHLLDLLARRTGRSAVLHPDPVRAIHAVDVH